jgi:prepilin-type N-terminal cleavage/methylation domain-containing protein
MSAPGRRSRVPRAAAARGTRSLGEGGRGFTLIELLLSTAVVVLVVGAITTLAPPLRRAFDGGLAASDIAARGRTAIAAIANEAGTAGSGIVIGPSGTRLSDVMPVIVPSRAIEDPRLVPPFSAVTIAHATGPQGLLRDRAAAGALALRLDTGAPCTEQDATCRLRAGDTAVLFDGTRAELTRVVAVTAAAATLHVSAPLAAAYDPGTVVAAVERTAYGLRQLADGSARLVRITAGGAEQPIADHVSAFEIATDLDRYDADLVRVRRLDVALRLESPVRDGRGLELRTSIAVRQ